MKGNGIHHFSILSNLSFFRIQTETNTERSIQTIATVDYVKRCESSFESHCICLIQKYTVTVYKRFATKLDMLQMRMVLEKNRPLHRSML
jgi:hypothetical protein